MRLSSLRPIDWYIKLYKIDSFFSFFSKIKKKNNNFTSVCNISSDQNKFNIFFWYKNFTQVKIVYALNEKRFIKTRY